MEKIIGKKLGKQKTPYPSNWKPETENSPDVNDQTRNKYQKLLGIGIWLVVTCRIDICFPVSTLSRYTHVAKDGHMEHLVRVFEYLHKWPKVGIKIQNRTIQWKHNEESEKNVQ